MSSPGLLGDDPVAAVNAWREQGVARVDPVRFAVIEALARRAAAQQGETRRRMILRIQALQVPPAASTAPVPYSAAAHDEHAERRVVLAGLSELVDRLGRSQGAQLPRPATPIQGGARRDDAPCAAPLPAALQQASRNNAVSAFKGTWSRLRAEQRLRQVLAQVPAKAGPLNSAHLISRTLQAMRDLSPAYLDAFMLNVDTLLWLEQASGAGDLTPRTATSAERERKPTPRGGRKA